MNLVGVSIFCALSDVNWTSSHDLLLSCIAGVRSVHMRLLALFLQLIIYRSNCEEDVEFHM
jgi:hypothetical protein